MKSVFRGNREPCGIDENCVFNSESTSKLYVASEVDRGQHKITIHKRRKKSCTDSTI
ncbi:hypothetical protein Mapa_003731 [Marchantia paleacea]|nr:hypothetical protein Mapa_003731 [Marchantia paleacea]